MNTSLADRSHNPEARLGSVWSLQKLSDTRVVTFAQASLAEYEVPVPAVSKVAARLLFQPGLESKEDGSLCALPRVLACQVVVSQDHVLDCRSEVAEHFGPDRWGFVNTER